MLMLRDETLSTVHQFTHGLRDEERRLYDTVTSTILESDSMLMTSVVHAYVNDHGEIVRPPIEERSTLCIDGAHPDRVEISIDDESSDVESHLIIPARSLCVMAHEILRRYENDQ